MACARKDLACRSECAYLGFMLQRTIHLFPSLAIMAASAWATVAAFEPSYDKVAVATALVLTGWLADRMVPRIAS